MATECCWPFCGAEPNECDCADNVKKEVMQNDAGHFPVPRPVAPPPVSEAGGDLPTNDEKTNMTDEACKENAGKLTVPLPQRFALIHGLLNPQANGTLCRYEDAIAYGDERCARETAALLGLIADIRKAAGDPTGKLMQAELVELIGRQREECDKAKEAEESDFESMEMYRRARDRADRITAAARAVVDRWETPLWKDAPATAGFIYALRDAIAAGGGSTSMKVTNLTKQKLASRRQEDKLKAQGYEYVGEGGGKLWELARGYRVGQRIVAVEIATHGLGVWVKIGGGHE